MSKKFDKLLDKATDSILLDPAWENILLCVDSVKSGETTPKIAIGIVRKRYRHENPHVRHHALLVLEALVKNCGEKLHKELATQDFMEDLKRLASENQSAEKVRDKILELIQCWAHAFRNKTEFKVISDTHNLMKLEGFAFPPMRESDAMFDAQSAPEWIDSLNCHRCNVEFGILTRKHHCRNCGQVFCDKCSNKYVPLPQFGIEADVRVCENCFDKIKSKERSTIVRKSSSSDIEKRSSPVPKAVNKDGKTEAEIREEEEFQMALAISQSEHDEKERQKKMKLNSSLSQLPYENNQNDKICNEADECVVKHATGYFGAMDKPKAATSSPEGSETEGELAHYLNRSHWEAKRSQSQKKGILRRHSPSPSAPPVNSNDTTTTTNHLNGKGPDDSFDKVTISSTSPVLSSDFIRKMHDDLEIFVNRIRNNVARGRSVVTDSAVQSMFMNLSTVHAQVLQSLSHVEEKRGFSESLQDKLTQIKDARAAVTALREEHAQRRQAELLEAHRQQQLRMAAKLDVMRQQKYLMLEQQRQEMLRRSEEHRREIEARRLQQMQQAAGVSLANTSGHAMYDVGNFTNVYSMYASLPTTGLSQQPVNSTIGYPPGQLQSSAMCQMMTNVSMPSQTDQKINPIYSQVPASLTLNPHQSSYLAQQTHFRHNVPANVGDPVQPSQQALQFAQPYQSHTMQQPFVPHVTSFCPPLSTIGHQQPPSSQQYPYASFDSMPALGVDPPPPGQSQTMAPPSQPFIVGNYGSGASSIGPVPYSINQPTYPQQYQQFNNQQPVNISNFPQQPTAMQQHHPPSADNSQPPPLAEAQLISFD